MLALLLPVCGSGAGPHELFKADSKKILRDNVTERSGYVFLAGQARSNSTDPQIGFRRAQLNAHEQLLRYLGGKINYPKSVPTSLRRLVFEEYLKAAGIAFSVEKGEVVYRQHSGNLYTLVLAVPHAGIDFETPSYEAMSCILLSPAYASGPVARVSVLLEISDNPQELLLSFSHRMQRDYGDNLAAMFTGTIAPGFSLRTFREIERTKTFRDNSMEELFVLLNQVPYHPRLCFELAERLEKDGLLRNAELLRTCGSISPALSSEYAEKCRRKLPKTPWLAIPPSLDFDLKPFSSWLGKTDFKDDLSPLNKLSGRIPGGMIWAVDEYYQAGLNAFQANQLPEAYEYFCKSLAENISFDACNMGGNTARRIGRPTEAIALLLQAAVLNPKSPYPWVNLALAFDHIQEKTLVEYCLKQAEQRPLDDWSKQQIKHLKTK